LKTLFALICAVAASFSTPRTDTSRGPLDIRTVAGVVRRADAVDIYWTHTNERIEPVRSQLLRTTISKDGRQRLSASVIVEVDGGISASVDGNDANVQVLWQGVSGKIRASPIVDGALKYPGGKLVREGGSYAVLHCRASECIAVYDIASRQTVTRLDSDSNAIGAAFELPAGYYPLRMELDEQGIFFVRHQANELRAALVRLDGSVQYDIRVAPAEPVAFHAGPVGVAFNGSEHAVAYVDFATQPDEVRMVTISGTGTIGAPVRVLPVEEFPEFANNVSGLTLAWNGTAYVLGGSYISGRPFLLQLDAAFQPVASPIRPDAAPRTLETDGTNVVITWGVESPFVTVLSADGRMSPPVVLEEAGPAAPRRRSARS
jgi:hypothetical protein